MAVSVLCFMTMTGTVNTGPYAGQTFNFDLPTAKIPELPAVTLPYDPTDKIPLFDQTASKTAWTAVSDFKAYLIAGITGGGVAPTATGAILEIPITTAMASPDGSVYTVNVPSLMSQSFRLERRGIGALASTEYLVVPSGGFTLISATQDPIHAGELFFATILNYTKGSSTTSGFLNGQTIISATGPMLPSHYNKLIHVAGLTNKLTYTLADLGDAPDNLVVAIETDINNSVQQKISAKSGQLIYYGNTSQTYIYLGRSEFIMLYKGVDGWYVMNASESILNVGKPGFDYALRLNQELAIGQAVNRADYPRLWDWVNSNILCRTDETSWASTVVVNGETVRPFRGKFTSGDGVATFRFPDLQDLSFVGLKNVGGADPNRYENSQGTVQEDSLRSHTHGVKPPDTNSSTGAGKTTTGLGASAIGGITQYDTLANNGASNQTRSRNAGFLPIINI